MAHVFSIGLQAIAYPCIVAYKKSILFCRCNNFEKFKIKNKKWGKALVRKAKLNFWKIVYGKPNSDILILLATILYSVTDSEM